MEKSWNELIESIKYMIEGTFHTNDMSTHESEEALCCALERFAEANGLPEPDWGN